MSEDGDAGLSEGKGCGWGRCGGGGRVSTLMPMALCKEETETKSDGCVCTVTQKEKG